MPTTYLARDRGEPPNSLLPDVDPCACLLLEEHLEYCRRVVPRPGRARAHGQGQLRLPHVARRGRV